MQSIYIESLGCAKNRVDTENALGVLDGYYIYSNEPENADFLIVNTCAFIHDAEDESYQFISSFCDLKAQDNHKKVVVMGCLGQVETDKLLEEYPVDAIVGTGSFYKIRNILDRLTEGETGIVLKDSIDTEIPLLPRIVTTPNHYAFLKISEGCDNRCTYCLIPSIRGKYRSRTMEDILDEARQLDVDEIILIAQDTSRYGIDLYGKPMLAELLQKLDELERVRWIRIHYLYPDLLDDHLLEAIFNSKKVLRYFDIPVQHVSDRMLKLMNRHTNQHDIQTLFDKIRAYENQTTKYGRQKASIRTTFIVGFPGETEDDFNQLVNFVEKNNIDRLGVFTYSDLPKIAAFKMGGKVSESEKERRKQIIMQLQQRHSSQIMENFVGKTIETVVEEYIEEEDMYIGRSYLDSPEIDGEVFVYSDIPLEIGDFIMVNVLQSAEYDLVGEYIEYCE